MDVTFDNETRYEDVLNVQTRMDGTVVLRKAASKVFVNSRDYDAFSVSA